MNKKISEKVLRTIWREQNFKNLPLITADGKEIKVISAGRSNPDGGPDFLNAKIYIGDSLFVGDVEIHLNYTDWKIHHHDKDPKYDRVILHIVFFTVKSSVTTITKSNRIIPILFLENFVDETIIESTYEKIFKTPITDFVNLKCRDNNANISTETLKNWLIKLSMERIEYKVRRMDERLKELIHFEKLKEPFIKYAGEVYEFNLDDLPDFEPEYSIKDFSDIKFWEQLFYEFLMEALGYIKNKNPFLKLARIVTLNELRKLEFPQNETERIDVLESILFIYSGLVPDISEVKGKETKNYIEKLLQLYESSNIKIPSQGIKAVGWQFFRLRPENFPTLRIAGAAHLIEKILFEDFFKTIIKIFTSDSNEIHNKIQSLIKLFQVKAFGYWKTHYRFDKKSTGEIKILIGKEKIIEIIINVLIPLLLLYARIFRKREIRENILKIFQQLKTSKSNYLIRKIDKELLHKKINIDNAVFYQGVIQLYKFYCIENKCIDCAIYKELNQA